MRQRPEKDWETRQSLIGRLIREMRDTWVLLSIQRLFSPELLSTLKSGYDFSQE